MLPHFVDGHKTALYRVFGILTLAPGHPFALDTQGLALVPQDTPPNRIYSYE